MSSFAVAFWWASVALAADPTPPPQPEGPSTGALEA